MWVRVRGANDDTSLSFGVLEFCRYNLFTLYTDTHPEGWQINSVQQRILAHPNVIIKSNRYQLSSRKPRFKSNLLHFENLNPDASPHFNTKTQGRLNAVNDQRFV